ncbi:MAG: DUF2339 domain-containing protein [Alphaproteobacteria bacterium]|nr:DUF2339 domain-containing protein [Alphaproteobacteria bacterium]
MWVLAFLPLAVWVLLQAQRIDALTRRVAELELQLFSARSANPSAPPTAPEGVPPAPATPAPEPAPAQDELLLTEVVPDDVLVLDNPLPAASNDMAPMPEAVASSSRPRMHSPLLLNDPIDEAERPPGPPTPPPTKSEHPPRRLDQWLAEKGLAWIAGIALAMGAIYLVSVAMQSTWFTPAVQLASAVGLGVVLLGVSELARRVGLRTQTGHPLIAALLAGAGMVTFYATSWAAHGVYAFVDWPAATALLALCAIGLIALSFLHGQALGILAIALALLAPALANAPLWPSLALTSYVALVGAGGFALALFKRWAWVAIATIGGLYFWFFASITADDVRRALTLISFASVGGALMAFRAPIADESKKGLTWTAIHEIGPSIAISVSSALLIWAWLIVAQAPAGRIAGPALISIFHVALVTYAVSERRAAPAALAIAIGGLTLGFMAYLRARGVYAPLGGDFYPTVLLASFSTTVCAMLANPERSGRPLIAGSGAIGAALLTIFAAVSRPDWHAIAAWAPLFTTAALLFGAAWWTERTTEDRKSDSAITWWGGAGAVLVLLGVESLLTPEMRTLGHAGAALLFSTGLAWRGWRVASWAALTSAALAIGHALSPGDALSPSLISMTLARELALWAGLLTFASAATLLFGASTVIRRSNTNIPIAEALSATAAITILTGAFVALRWVAAGNAGVTLDGFAETSLRVLGLMAAGLTLLPRIHESPGPIGAWRGHVLLCFGLLYALLVPGMLINPWWGGPGRAVVSGWPVLNALALAFAAPAALAFWAAGRLYVRQRLFARLYAVAGAILALMWLVLEIRHEFHNGAMAEPLLGLFESACYALAFLGFALAVAIVARLRARRNPHRPFTEDLMHSMRAVSWGGLGAAVFIMLIAQHPIWGLHDSRASNAFSTMLAVLAQPAAMILALALGRALSVSREAEPTRFAAASTAALFAWSFGHCAIRWLHHRGYMDDGFAPYAMEGLAHALWPLIFVIAAAQLTRFAPGRDTTRAYLYDLKAIWAAAIWPALGFAALGLWLLYNPWWGIWPAQTLTLVGAIIALLAYLGAAALSYAAPDVPHVRAMKWMAPGATVFCAAHIFVAATLAVRWLYYGSEMAGPQSGDVELWIYSAVWAVFAAMALGLGTMRDDPVLRWIGLAVFGATIVKVFFIDTAQLSGIIRAVSLLGLGAIAAIATWMSRRNRPPPGPGDLVTVTPSARRERRRVRRRTSQ